MSFLIIMSVAQVTLLVVLINGLSKFRKLYMATEQQVIDALTKIDGATTQIATNLQVEVTTTQTISDEVDALVTALKNAGVSQALVDQASAVSDKVQASSDAIAAQIPVLQAIAAKGVQNPVPVPVPTP